MSDRAQSAAGVQGGAAGLRRGPWRLIVVATIGLLAAAGGGAAYYYRVYDRSPSHVTGHDGQAGPVEQPLPFYLAVKPFVVSMRDGEGAVHLVQLGVNLVLWAASSSNLVTAMLPEIADRLRLTMLSDQLKDITTPAGVDRLRVQMTNDLNHMLQQRLGAERIAAATKSHDALVKNVYFSQLIVQ
jgi:flagellar basal body-associated protein FliL